MKRRWKIAIKILCFLAAAELCLLAAGFFAVRFKWTNVKGEEDPNSALYTIQLAEEQKAEVMPNTLPNNGSIFGPNEEANWCKLGIAADVSPYNAAPMFEAYWQSHSEILLRRMLFALSLRLPDRPGFEEKLKQCETATATESSLASLVTRLEKPTGTNLYTWQNHEPWRIIRQGLIKDKETIYRAAEAAGVQPRLLVSVAIVEQLRLYYTQRELFEKVFKPLKILASANKMAWGVMSIKENMAIATESHLKDTTSPFYLGSDKERLLDFPAGKSPVRERYARLTDERNHYYSYLYGGLIIKQMENQWQKAGFPLEYRPEVVATLFNIGFNNSEPKSNPAVGGSTISIEGKKYYFGSLAYEFYYSGDLMDEFPYK